MADEQANRQDPAKDSAEDGGTAAGLPVPAAAPTLPGPARPVRCCAMADEIAELGASGGGAMIAVIAATAALPAAGVLVAGAAPRGLMALGPVLMGVLGLLVLVGITLTGAWLAMRRLRPAAPASDLGYRRGLVCAYLDALDRAAFGGRSRLLPRR